MNEWMNEWMMESSWWWPNIMLFSIQQVTSIGVIIMIQCILKLFRSVFHYWFVNAGTKLVRTMAMQHPTYSFHAGSAWRVGGHGTLDSKGVKCQAKRSTSFLVWCPNMFEKGPSYARNVRPNLPTDGRCRQLILWEKKRSASLLALFSPSVSMMRTRWQEQMSHKSCECQWNRTHEVPFGWRVWRS